MSDYANIKDAIKDKLETITEIKETYGYEKGQFDDYPSATVGGFKLDEEWSDTAANIRKWSFRVRIYQEMEKEGKGPEEAETIIDEIADKIIDTFDNDRYLSAVDDVIGVWVTAGNSWEDRELNMRILELEVQVKKPYTLT